jgi:glycosyltransferase involved in cell wall biosynthesis
MRVAFITRSTLFKVHGGDTVQVMETAKHLKTLGVSISVILTNEKINYSEFDLLHFFNITRPSDILFHINKSDKPFVLSPILIDYSEYDKSYRVGLSGFIFRRLSASGCEYIKTISRWIMNKDKLKSKSYLWKGHKKSGKEIIKKAYLLLPNSLSEIKQLAKIYSEEIPYIIVPNGIDPSLFKTSESFTKESNLVICVARIEGIKNQLTLIKALNGTEFTLLIIGNPAPNQQHYYRKCRQIALKNIQFIGWLSHEDLKTYYQKAKVHVLPSWFETCGLSSLEAAAMGCNIVITEKGFTRDYFENDAFYCQPDDSASIYNAVKMAAESKSNKTLQEKVLKNFTWKNAAAATLEAYKKAINNQ